MSDRIGVLKTYKMFIDGKFPRTESGRFYQVFNKNIPIANMCLSSRKDIRNAVVAARKATGSWASKSANNRSQILYRIAENLESRKEQFIEEIIIQGKNKNAAKKEVELSIDRIIYFAGWCDKINQVFGAVNPVASSHFNFSMLEPMGVVGVVAPEKDSLLGVVSAIIPPLVAGNSTVLISSEELPLCSVTFAEVLATSDVPSGVVNILTGRSSELLGHLSTHMDVNAIFYCKNNSMEVKEIQIAAVDNLKRIIILKNEDLSSNKNENPYLVTNFMETKTTWHPIEKISGAGSGY